MFCRSFEGNINELTEAALDEMEDVTMNGRKCVLIFHWVFSLFFASFYVVSNLGIGPLFQENRFHIAFEIRCNPLKVTFPT